MNVVTINNNIKTTKAKMPQKKITPLGQNLA